MISLLVIFSILISGCFAEEWRTVDNKNHLIESNSNINNENEDTGQTYSNLVESPSIAAVNSHSLAVDHQGILWIWGKVTSDTNSDLQLKPRRISGISDVSSVVGNWAYTLVLKRDGSVWGWGDNRDGQLGDGTYISRLKPVQIIGLEDIQAIDARVTSAIALKKDGTVWTWGDNMFGQLGVDRDNGEVPAQVPGLQDIVSVTAGNLGSLALQEDGTVWAWGYGPQLDLNVEGVGQDIPAKVEGINDVVDISAIGADILALKKDGTVWSWGSGGPPIMVEELTNINAIKQGITWSYAIDQDGIVWIWTGNEKPRRIPGLSDIVSIAGGKDYTIVVDAEGNLWSWGDNTYGQLGDGTTESRETPVQISLEEGAAIENDYTDQDVFTLKYDNTEISFSVETPSSWKDKYFVKQQEDWVGIYHNTTLPLEKAANLLSFHILSLKEWEEYLIEMDDGYPLKKVGEKGDLIIVSTQIAEQPYSSSTSEETEEVMRMLEDIDEVRISNIYD